MLAAGVVEVLAGGKDLDRLRAGAGGELQQAGMQPLIHEQMRGQDAPLGHRKPPSPSRGGTSIFAFLRSEIIGNGRMRVVGLPPIPQRTRNRWGTEHQVVLSRLYFQQNQQTFSHFESQW